MLQAVEMSRLQLGGAGPRPNYIPFLIGSSVVGLIAGLALGAFVGVPGGA